MPQKQVSYRTGLNQSDASIAAQEGIEKWKLGRAFGLKRFEPQAYEATRAGQQTGSVVRYAIDSNQDGTIVTVGIHTVKWALKNPMSGVFKSVEKVLRSRDSEIVRL